MTTIADFHRNVLPRGIVACDVGGPGRSVGLLLDDGSTAFTYRATETGVTIEAGGDADVVAELDAAAFDDLIAERRSILGLLFPGRLNARES